MLKRNDGRYCKRIMRNGNVKYIYSNSKVELGKKVKDFLIPHSYFDILQAKVASEEVTRIPTLTNWLWEWLEIYKNKNKPSTIAKQTNLIKKIIATLPCVNDTLDKIKPLNIIRFLQGIDKPRQREHFYTLLKDCLHRAYTADILKNDITKGISITKHDSKETVILSPSEEILFVERAKKDTLYPIFALMLGIGCRVGEACALRVNNIDFDKNIISIKKTRDARFGEGAPKTKAGIRDVPIFDSSRPILMELVSGLKDNDYIVQGSPWEYGEHYKKICEYCDIKGTIPYSLRHTFGTKCAKSGIAPKVLQKWLGHSTIGVTMRYYIHVTTDWEKNQISIMNS